MNYIEIKVTVWNRIRFKDETDMKQLIDIINDNGVEATIDDDLGFMECESLYDTEDKMTVAENFGNSTIEVYQDGQLIWENAKQSP
jgi:hypothetical protein